MGRGTKSHEKNVLKKVENFKGSESGGSKETAYDGCIFSFETTLKLDPSIVGDVKLGLVTRIIPNHSDSNELDIFVGNRNFGAYRGNHLQKIRNCIKAGYIYEGEVKNVRTDVDKAIITVSIGGKGR